MYGLVFEQSFLKALAGASTGTEAWLRDLQD